MLRLTAGGGDTRAGGEDIRAGGDDLAGCGGGVDRVSRAGALFGAAWGGGELDFAGADRLLRLAAGTAGPSTSSRAAAPASTVRYLVFLVHFMARSFPLGAGRRQSPHPAGEPFITEA